MSNKSLVRRGSSDLSLYIKKVNSFPMLSAKREKKIIKRMVKYNSSSAADELICSHLRLVIKIALDFRGYGFPINELIEEGNIGLIHAVKKFDPQAKNRLSTYAVWWIRAMIQKYILDNWSIAKVITKVEHKKLFFKLNQAKKQLRITGNSLTDKQSANIAKKLDVSVTGVKHMNDQMSYSNLSLNAPVRKEEGSSVQWQDTLYDDSHNQEKQYIKKEQSEILHKLLFKSMNQTLNAREYDILSARRLKDKKLGLEELANKYGISKERIRQIEVAAFKKVSLAMRKEAQEGRIVF